MNMQHGRLEVLLGPVRSNKTAELLRRVGVRRTFAGQYVLVTKPNDDDECPHGIIESRNPLGHDRMEAAEFNPRNPSELLRVISKTESEIGKKVECIAIDKGQFVKGLFSFTKHLLDTRYDVLVAGLDLDFRAIPFGEMTDLMWLADVYGGNVTRCIAYCKCGNRALYSQRFIDGHPAPYHSPLKRPGDSYEPRCEEHFVLPGR